MVVGNFDIEGVPTFPPEADAPLTVDADAELASPTAAQFLEAIAGIPHQVLVASGRIQHVEAPQCPKPKGLELPDLPAFPQALRILIPKAFYHQIIVIRIPYLIESFFPTKCRVRPGNLGISLCAADVLCA
jgi:hypothetical protein